MCFFYGAIATTDPSPLFEHLENVEMQMSPRSPVGESDCPLKVCRDLRIFSARMKEMKEKFVVGIIQFTMRATVDHASDRNLARENLQRWQSVCGLSPTKAMRSTYSIDWREFARLPCWQNLQSCRSAASVAQVIPDPNKLNGKYASTFKIGMLSPSPCRCSGNGLCHYQISKAGPERQSYYRRALSTGRAWLQISRKPWSC